MICPEKKCVFIHIPKTGGNSVNAAFDAGWSDHKDLEKLASEETREIIDAYFKFCIVRNPWARLFADYNFQKRKSRGEKLFLLDENGKTRSFADWVEAVFADPFRYEARTWGGKVSEGIHRWSPLTEWQKLDGVIATDFVAKLENITEDFPKICDALGIPRKKLPKKNSRFHFHYSRYFDEALVARVGKYYEEDIDTFKYAFND